MELIKTTQRSTYVWLAVAFFTAFLATGSQLWPGSYQEYLSRGGGTQLVATVAIVATLVAAISSLGIMRCALAVGCGFPAATFARVVADGLQDPTSHNLWPFEVGIALIVGMAAAWPAAFVGALIRYLGRRLGGR
jgi:hypothetical protein